MTKSAPALALLPDTADDEDARQQVALLKALLVTVQHCFGGFQRLFGTVTDPRHLHYSTYPLSALLATGLGFRLCWSVGAQAHLDKNGQCAHAGVNKKAPGSRYAHEHHRTRQGVCRIVASVGRPPGLGLAALPGGQQYADDQERPLHPPAVVF